MLVAEKAIDTEESLGEVPHFNDKSRACFGTAFSNTEPSPAATFP